MDKKGKITSIILWVLMIVSIVLFAYMVVSIDDESNPGAKAVQAITLNLNWASVLFLIAGASALIFAVIQILGDKAKIISTVIALFLLAAVVAVAYSLASSEIPNFFGVDKFLADGTLNETISRWVGTGLYVVYILFGGAILSIAGFGAANVFKRS
ncbi:MAG: hypothetical protein PF436_02380 [Prolixibacteraceae bacterium]|jgi:uncharacterized membrane protein YphA (DoxX/SURF4 family)|nr:hypothetical protein [Prolixibacteraceae bacterium]